MMRSIYPHFSRYVLHSMFREGLKQLLHDTMWESNCFCCDQ